MSCLISAFALFFELAKLCLVDLDSGAHGACDYAALDILTLCSSGLCLDDSGHVPPYRRRIRRAVWHSVEVADNLTVVRKTRRKYGVAVSVKRGSGVSKL